MSVLRNIFTLLSAFTLNWALTVFLTSLYLRLFSASMGIQLITLDHSRHFISIMDVIILPGLKSDLLTKSNIG